ncbi:MAG: hypothetical protein BJ554DRAFT_3337, partial [Olpidium bornovanus]
MSAADFSAGRSRRRARPASARATKTPADDDDDDDEDADLLFVVHPDFLVLQIWNQEIAGAEKRHGLGQKADVRRHHVRVREHAPQDHDGLFQRRIEIGRPVAVRFLQYLELVGQFDVRAVQLERRQELITGGYLPLVVVHAHHGPRGKQRDAHDREGFDVGPLVRKRVPNVEDDVHEEARRYRPGRVDEAEPHENVGEEHELDQDQSGGVHGRLRLDHDETDDQAD